jgi:PPK2 family polyphosphate:nucleotide phosphotransferase
VSYAKKIEPGAKVNLSKIDTKETGGLTKEEAIAKTVELSAEMSELTEMLYAAGQTGLLIVLQGRDTAGKDGAIIHLLKAINVQGFQVASFKVPTDEERSHDFLWRVHKHAPGRGNVAIFNRSHYEDVLVVRVHDLVPKSVWKQRYGHINDFEKLLVESGVVIVKFYLHISKDEQERRLFDREQEVGKAWKLSAGDWKERQYWDDYTEAYGDALSNCSTEVAPWYLIQADHKWFRNLAITEAVVQALRPFKKSWMEHLKQVGERAKAELAEYRKTLPTAVTNGK